LRAADLEKRCLAAFISRQSDESTIGALHQRGARSAREWGGLLDFPLFLMKFMEFQIFG
jgi:hypothetical protein